MHTEKLMGEIWSVSLETIREFEQEYMIDSSEGDYLGVLDSLFFKQVFVLLAGLNFYYNETYSELALEDLTAEQEIERRGIFEKRSLLEKVFYFEVDMAFDGRLTYEEWADSNLAFYVTAGWRIWKQSFKTTRKSGSKRSKIQMAQMN